MDLADVPTVELEDTFRRLGTLRRAIHLAQLQVGAELDRRQAWRDDGMPSFAVWVATTCKTSERTARETQRIARALEELPAIAEAYGTGELSEDQLAAVTRFATPEDDARWASEAPGWSAAQLALHARRAKQRTVKDAVDAHGERFVKWHHDDDGPVGRLWATLPSDQLATVIKALERRAAEAGVDPETGEREPFAARCADALADICGASIGADADPDRATIVVHVDADVLASDEADGRCHLEHGSSLASATVRRLCCDARMQLVFDGRDGKPVGVGRTQRTVPPWLARLVRERDGGCRCCGRRYRTHIHHIDEWEDGGPTDLDNVCELCVACHWRVHEGGWTIEGHPDKTLMFRNARGEEFPRPLDPDPAARQRLMRLLPPWIRPPDTS